MPAEGKPPLKPEEIAWIKAWILQGASPAATSLAGIVVPEPYREIALPQVGDYSGMLAQISQVDDLSGSQAGAGIEEAGGWPYFEHGRRRGKI